MNTPVKWVADLSQVREVSLLGTADLDFWKDRLLKEDLAPAENNGKAQLLIVAADMRFMGVRFQEVSVSVLVSGPKNDARRDACFLVHAFNSRRLAAFCERVFFSTPYSYGKIQLSPAVPCSIQLIRDGHVALRAAMHIDSSSPSREPSFRGEAGWDGPIFLPGRRQEKDGQGKLFFGKLTGHTLRYPFQPTNDVLTIWPSQGSDVLGALIDSHFAPQEWLVREAARHAKSKTYNRSEVF
jgi:hypothetical protein